MIFISLCLIFLKHKDFHTARRYESMVCSDWPNSSSMWRKNFTTLKKKKVSENADDQTDQLNKPAYQIYKVLFYKQSSLTFKLKHTVPSPHGGGSNKSTSYVFFLLRKYLSADLTNFSQIKI